MFEYDREVRELVESEEAEWALFEEENREGLCKYDGAPCFRKRRCFVRVSDFCYPLYVCCRVRFKGSNSVVDKGKGMTVFEKLHRMGLVPPELLDWRAGSK